VGVVSGGDDVERVGVRVDGVALGRGQAARAQAGVDDGDAEPAGEVERGGDGGRGALTAGVQDAKGQDVRARGDAADADGVLRGGDGAGDVGAVAVLVGGDVVGGDEVPAAPVVDVAVVVVVEVVGLAPGAGLAGVRGDLAGEIGLGQGDAGVDDGDGDARAGGAERPCLGGVDVGVEGAGAPEDRLAGVAQRPLLGEAGVGGRGVDRRVGLGVDDVGVGVERGERLGQLAGGGADDLGLGEGEHLLKLYVGVRAQRGAVVAVQAGAPLDDDVAHAGALERDRVGRHGPAAVGTRSGGRRHERGDGCEQHERAGDDGDHVPYVSAGTGESETARPGRLARLSHHSTVWSVRDALSG
jgi:hypothetical protein